MEEMSYEKQKLLICYMLSNADLFIKANPILKSSFFDPRLKSAIEFMQTFYGLYKGVPTTAQLFAETDIKIEVNSISLTNQELRYAEDTLEKFLQFKTIEQAIFQSVDLLHNDVRDGIVKLIRDAASIGFQKNLGTAYFKDPASRLTDLTLQDKAISTGMKSVDRHIGGGCNRQELTIITAPSGVGKSITMSNIAANFCLQGLYGIYFTLELSEKVVAKRFDSMFTGIAQYEILNNISKVTTELSKLNVDENQLDIKRLPESTTTTADLRAYIQTYEAAHGRLPDFIVVDYLDLMASGTKVSVENVFMKDKFVSEELRALCHEINCVGITASQLNRGAQQIESLEDLNQGHIAGGLSKIMTADNVIAVIQNATMKARGELMFKMLKVRSGTGTDAFFIMKFCNKSLRVTDVEDLPIEHMNKPAIRQVDTKPKSSEFGFTV